MAVKRVFASRSGLEGLREFCNEISILHKISAGSPHPNLLRLYVSFIPHITLTGCIITRANITKPPGTEYVEIIPEMMFVL